MSMSIISNIIRDFFFFLALNDEKTVDPGEAVAMRDWLLTRLREMDTILLQQIVDRFNKDDGEQEDCERVILQDIVYNLQPNDALLRSDRNQIQRPHGSRIFCQLSRIIADIHLFLELTGEDKLNLDDSVKMMEFMAGWLDELAPPFLRALVDAFAEIAPEYGKAGEAVVRDMPRAYGLEETLAADDPVRLAELEALDDAYEMEERHDPLADFPGVDWRADVRRPYLAAT